MNLPGSMQRALEGSLEQGFGESCIPEVGKLLQLLVAAAEPGTVAELGTGRGVDSAWMLSGLREGQRFLSAESDPAHHRAVSRLFGDVPSAHFLCGDWLEALAYGPFRLVFVDVRDAKDAGAEAVMEALAVSGVPLLDDFTPETHWPPEWRGQSDLRRDRWLRHPRLLATEILTTPETAAIIAVRVR